MPESITTPTEHMVPEIERTYTARRLARVASLLVANDISVSRPFSVNGTVGYEFESDISVSKPFSAIDGTYGYGPSQSERELEEFVRDPENFGDSEAPSSAIPINDGDRESISV